MAENTTEYGINYVAVNRTGVNRRLELVEKGIASPTFKNSITNQIKVLKMLQGKLETQEKNFYGRIGVKNINELNERVQKSRGLRALAGSTLSRELDKFVFNKKEYTDIDIVESIYRDIEEDFNKKVDDYLDNQQEIFKDEAVSIFIDSLVECGITIQKYHNNTNRGFSKLFDNFDWDKNTHKFVQKQGSKGKKAEYWVTKIKKTGENNENFKITLSYNTQLTQNNNFILFGLKSEDYQKLSDDEQKEGRRQLYDLGYNIIKNNFGTPEELEAYDKSFRKYPNESFLTSTKGGLMGIYGEIAAGAFLLVITNNTSTSSFRHTGQERNLLKEKKPQLAIDIILDEYGFQVKNYNEFSRKGREAFLKANATVLKQEGSFDYWMKTFNLEKNLQEILKLFYSTEYFNVPYTKKWKDYANNEGKRIDQIEMSLNHLYTAFLNKYLRISEYAQMKEQTNPATYYNTFYFVSGYNNGSTFYYIPSSKVLEKIINLFEKLDNIQNSDIVKATSSYNGTNIKEYKHGTTPPTVESIVKGVSLQMSVLMEYDKIIGTFNEISE